MKQDFTKPNRDLDVFVHEPTCRPVASAASRVPVPVPKNLAVHLARIIEIYGTDDGLPIIDLLPALAKIVVDLVEFPAAADPDRRRGALIALRTAIDGLYPSSVWPDDTTLIDGRFVWGLRERIAIQLQEIEETK